MVIVLEMKITENNLLSELSDWRATDMNKYIKYESWEEAAEEIKQSIDDGFVKAVDIAEKAGISKQTISNYLNGIYKPDYNICIKMLKCAGLIYNCDDAYTDADEIEDVSQEIDATNISKKGEMYASRGFLLVHDEKHNEIVINPQVLIEPLWNWN